MGIPLQDCRPRPKDTSPKTLPTGIDVRHGAMNKLNVESEARDSIATGYETIPIVLGRSSQKWQN
jgi:regulatory protein YycH of two-component signal transduction system YycFG